MSKKINLDVIDQFFAAQLSANESEATIKDLRDHFRVVDPQKQMEWELTHHCEI